MADQTIVKGFRTNCAYFPETTFGTSAIDKTHARKIGGKVKGVNWTARQNIFQTGSIGDGRNYAMQVFGNYDASASVNFEVIDFTFLKHAVGDIGKWGAGTSSTIPYFLVESELTGVDGTAGDFTKLTCATASTTAASSFTTIRIRPFSMLLYDIEDANAGATFNWNVDLLKGCMISDFSLSGSVGGPLMCSANMVVREISYRRALASASEVPDFGSSTTATGSLDVGSAWYGTTTPLQSYNISQETPLMFYSGSLTSYFSSSDSGHVLGQVTSFTYNWNNSLITYRGIGSRFIEMPQTGMRKQTLTANVVFRIPTGDGALATSNTNPTSILEYIKNYLGYASDAAFTTGAELRPALATTDSGTSPQILQPIEKYKIDLEFNGFGIGLGYSSASARGAMISVKNAGVEGFGYPIQLENGLIEVPITFSVRGYKYARVSDGSYNGYAAAAGAFTDYQATFSWWGTLA